MKMYFKQWVSGGIWWLPVMVFVVFSLVFLGTKSSYDTYMRVKAEGQTAQAVVSRVQEIQGDTVTDYRIYVDYTYNGRSYRNTYYMTVLDPKNCSVGTEMEIMIDVQAPDEPVSGVKPTNPVVFLVMGLVAFAVSSLISCFPLIVMRRKLKPEG